MPKEGHPYPVIASSNASYVGHPCGILLACTDRLVVGHNVSFDRACDSVMDTMSLHVAVNGISSHQRLAWNKWKKKKETQK
ncbi:hypothetical protein F5887DRAFT_963347, partial [Amanita rubescens]